MKPAALSLRWFNERCQPLPEPLPWQSAQLEIGGLPAGFPWQKLRLYSGLYAQEPTPLYLKRKTAQELILHADWPAAEPGFHHLRMYQTAMGAHPLWQYAFFIQAPPLTQTLWLDMLQSTYHYTHLRFQPRAPVSLEKALPSKNQAPESSHPVIEISRLQWLLSPAAKLSESLSLLGTAYTRRPQPLYRMRKVEPALLYRNIKALPLHASVMQRQVSIPEPISNNIHFLILALFQRYHWLSYITPQLSRNTPHLAQMLQQLSQGRWQLAQAWQAHPYRHSPPRWDKNSLRYLKNVSRRHPELRPWLHCAELLNASLAPGLAISPPLFTGYIGFGYVYQYWCTQHIHRALHKHLQARGWRSLPQASGLPPGRAIHWQSPTGERLVLYAERRYATNEKTLPAEPLYSISRGQQPDLSLVYFEGGTQWERQQAKSGLVFEIKFRQDAYGRPRKVDLDRLHAYRDAVYVYHPSQERHPLFVGGALLYPGRNERYSPGLEALTCLPHHELRLEYLLHHLFYPHRST